jgi:Coenzyme PQQ synthesis protein D (PqqD)
MAVDGSATIVRRSGVSLTWTGDEAVLVDSATGQVHVVNGTAGRAWELCEPETTVAVLKQSMASEYGLPESELDDDLDGLLGVFCELELIEIASPA